MLITNQTRTSMLYNTLSTMGMLCSEEYYIRKNRELTEDNTFFYDLPISNEDINRISYNNPHIELETSRKNHVEIWVNGEYQNPKKITWIDDYMKSYGVLVNKYDPSVDVANICYNPGIVYRYSNIVNDTTPHTHTVTIDLTNPRYENIEYPDRSAYYISNNQIMIPEVTWIDDHQIRFTARYTGDIDFILANNLVGVFTAKAGIGLYIDSPDSRMCYHHIVIDSDPTYPIDARFYPCIKIDKDCIVRVFSDSSHMILYPEVQRLVNYPEYAEVEDPYNTTIEYLRTLNRIDDYIYSTDSDDIIAKKFLRIVRFCYRIWEKLPVWPFEQSDFIICDNLVFGSEKFRSGVISLNDIKDTFIYTVMPAELHRDILLYQGEIFSDYRVVNLNETSSGMVQSDIIGTPRYIIPKDYDISKFTLIKFNAWEDTNFVNVGEYIDPKLTLRLYHKLNQFYRNLITLRIEVLDQLDYARIMTTEPSIADNYLWFELLTNVEPEKFKDLAPLAIDIYKTDGNIPKDIVNGAYALDMDPKDGPVNYKDILMTYYTLTEENKKYLALQYSDMGPSPEAKIFYDIVVGKPEQIDLPSRGLLIEDDSIDEPYTERVIDIGTEDQPVLAAREIGDLYAQVDDLLDAPDTVMTDLNELSFVGESGIITTDDISSYSRADKINMIKQHIAEDDTIQREQLLELPDSDLDRIIYKILETGYVIDQAESDTSEVSVVPTPSNKDDLNNIIQHNVKYIISEEVPDNVTINDVWIQVDDTELREEYYRNVVSHELLECYRRLPPNPTFTGGSATMVFDYGANSPADSDAPDIFKEVTDQKLHPIKYGGGPYENPEDNDIWYEYLEDTFNKVAYFDEETIVLHINERLIGVKFDHDNLEGFAFDDIVMNFHGKLGIKYLSIVADLINSNVINQDDLIVFYKRMITGVDEFKAEMRRLYTGTSHVVCLNKIDTSDYSIIYSTNIKRFRMNYSDPDTTNREREAAYRHCIYYKDRDFAFIPNRMLIFVNGKYIPRTEYHEEFAYNIQLTSFDEVISTVDILYSDRDTELMNIKKSAYAYWPLADMSMSIQRPERDYKKIEPIQVSDQTYRGFYDVLLDEYIFNGKLLRILSYLEEHPDEAELFKREIVHQFQAISDMSQSTMTEYNNPRIIISGNGTDQLYTISE